MRLVILSDTHGFHDRISVPPGDVLIHCGDATAFGTIQEVSAFNVWLGKQPHSYKIFVPGNHDRLFEQISDPRLFLTNASVLIDEEIVIRKVKIYGSPWQPEFCNWAFNLPRGKELEKKWDKIPRDTDVLITHGPPYGILDTVRKSDRANHLGCEELRLVVDRIKPKIHVFGHIHGSFGRYSNGSTQFVNASICTESYAPVNLPTVIDL